MLELIWVTVIEEYLRFEFQVEGKPSQDFARIDLSYNYRWVFEVRIHVEKKPSFC